MSNVSVVIATLGGDSIDKTINALNKGSIKPSEILICIPQECAHLLKQFKSIPNVKIIKTPCKGQVAQRAFGFQLATQDLVLQLDDDIQLHPDCLKNLIDCQRISGNAAVAPKMFDAISKKYHDFLVPKQRGCSWFQDLLFWVVSGRIGYRPGQIGRAGIGMGVPEYPNDWANLAWLPGGCILHRRSNLVLFDYYPFKGKAFAEDLFHSALLRKKGVNLIRCGLAICYVDFSADQKVSILGRIWWYQRYAKALREFLRQEGGSSFFLYAFLLLNLGAHVGSKFFIALRRPFGTSIQKDVV
jgi:glycosyltransferase involved in cell wall biosynthesis